MWWAVSMATAPLQIPNGTKKKEIKRQTNYKKIFCFFFLFIFLFMMKGMHSIVHCTADYCLSDNIPEDIWKMVVI